MKNKMRVIWLCSIACNGNSHSFLNYPYMEQFLSDFEFIYHPIVDSNHTLEDIVSQEIDCDILIIEGAISKEFLRADTSIVQIIQKYSKIAKKIVTLGTCATFGGIFIESEYDDVSGIHFTKDKKNNNRISGKAHTGGLFHERRDLFIHSENTGTSAG